jgi:hypothetical protein
MGKIILDIIYYLLEIYVYLDLLAFHFYLLTPMALVVLKPHTGQVYSWNMVFPEFNFIPFFNSALHFGH